MIVAIAESEHVTWKFRLFDDARVVCSGRYVFDPAREKIDEAQSFGQNSTVKWEPPQPVVDAAMATFARLLKYEPLEAAS